MLALLTLTGCWPQVGQGPEHRRHNAFETTLTRDNVTMLTQAWSIGPHPTEPIVWRGRVYFTHDFVTEAGGVVGAVDLGTGDPVWGHELFADRGVPAAVAGDALWIGGLSEDPNAGECDTPHYRLDLENGRTLSQTDDALLSPPVSAAGHIVNTSTVVEFSFAQRSCVGTQLMLTVRDEASSDVEWTATVPGGTASWATPIIALPTVADNQIYVANNTTVSAFPLEGCGVDTCEPVWTREFSSVVDDSPLVAAGDTRLFVQSQSGEFIAVDGRSGDEMFRGSFAASLSSGSTQPMAMAGDILYASVAGSGDGANRLLAFEVNPSSLCISNPEHCELWSAEFDVPVTSGPVVAGGVVYVGTRGAVHAFDADGCGQAFCQPIVSLSIEGRATALAVSQGRLLASTTGGMTAFAPIQ